MNYEEAKKIVDDYMHELVVKWSATNLLDGIADDIEKTNMSVLLESEPKQIFESEMTEKERNFNEAIRIVYKGKKLWEI